MVRKKKRYKLPHPPKHRAYPSPNSPVKTSSILYTLAAQLLPAAHTIFLFLRAILLLHTSSSTTMNKLLFLMLLPVLLALGTQACSSSFDCDLADCNYGACCLEAGCACKELWSAAPAENCTLLLREEAEVGGSTCTMDDDCGGSAQGVCKNATCTCTDKYAKEDCTYKRKSKLAAFLISFFVGYLGADRFYLGYIGVGVVKLLLPLVGPCILACIVLPFAKASGSGACACGGVLGCILVLAIVGWNVADWILILTGDLPDFQGFALYDDM